MTWLTLDNECSVCKHWALPHRLVVREAHTWQSAAFGIPDTIRLNHYWIKLAFTASYTNNSFWSSETRMYSWPRGGEPTFTEYVFREKRETLNRTRIHTPVKAQTNANTFCRIESQFGHKRCDPQYEINWSQKHSIYPCVQQYKSLLYGLFEQWVLAKSASKTQLM